MIQPRIPVSTYRLQFGARFTFEAARKIIPYLQEIGVTDIYASPYFKTCPGSASAYDIVDPSAFNPEVGSEADYAALVAELRSRGMGQILDIVPNHLCIAGDGNIWWQDVLENGLSSPYAGFFDIDWRPAGGGSGGRLLIPILVGQYGDALEGQEIRLEVSSGAFAVHYGGSTFPLTPETYPVVLDQGKEALEARLPPDDPRLAEFLSIGTALSHLPPWTEKDPEKVRERAREKEVIKKRLAALLDEAVEIRSSVEETVRLFNGRKGDHESFDRLDDLLGRQPWRLAHWRLATEEINYRRFLDLNHLAAVRMENEDAFAGAHGLVFKLVKEGAVTGLRIDHMDGLADPGEYARSLQKNCLARLAGEAGEPASPKPFFILVEKILAEGEALPAAWPVHGTTGYDFLNAVNGLFVDARNARAFDALYRRFDETGAHFADLAYGKKKLVMQVAMSGEVNALARQLTDLAFRNRHTRDFALNSLTKVLIEVIACFPVYRTYVTADEIGEQDRRSILQALAEAKFRNPAMSPSLFDFLGHVLLLDLPEEAGDGEWNDRLAFVRKFQQLTGPVMVKGIEDTAFYIDNRLASLNEVGGLPGRFGATVDAFHRQNAERLRTWPHGLNATSTHDTKRSEDVRARLDVLSEMPRAWRASLSRWSRANARKRRQVEGRSVPDRGEEYLIYQTLIGAWPPSPGERGPDAAFKDRIKAYMVKAMREAKVHSSWINPNTAREDAVSGFVEDILQDEPGNRFLPDFVPFQAAISGLGMYNSLSQTMLKIASPGVPDLYQGTEIWDYSLVDPDNRRPVDYAARIGLLEGLKGLEREFPAAEIARRLTAEKEDGRIKLYLTAKGLRYRREHRRLFERGEYLPAATEGPRAGNLCAFVRAGEGESVLAVVPRFLSELIAGPNERPLGESVWRDTFVVLPPGHGASRFGNIFTGEVVVPVESEGRSRLPVEAVLANFPVALLEASS